MDSSVEVIRGCSLFEDTVCPADQVCDLDPDLERRAQGETLCRPFVAGAGKDTACESDSDCDRGFGCRKNRQNQQGACIAYCQSDEECTSKGWRSCGPKLNRVTSMDVRYCEQDCDLRTSAGCPDSWTCRYVVSEINDATIDGRICLPECELCQKGCDDDGDCGDPNAFCTDEFAEQRYGDKLCSIPCDPIANSGCGPDAQCVLSGADPTFARCSLEGTAGEGDRCGDDVRCGPGLYCTGFGACMRYCEVGASDSCGGSDCRAFSTPLVYAGKTYGACRPDCDILTQTGCGEGTSCTRAFGWSSKLCLPTGARQHGETCDDQNRCVKGAICNGGICARYCNKETETDPECRCGGVFDEDDDDVGVCRTMR